MENWIISEWATLLNVAASTFLILILLVVFVRISGLRSFAKMTSIDFASTVAIGSILASTLLTENPSVLQGTMGIGFILLFQTIFARLTLKLPWFDKLVSNQPMLLMRGEEILYDNLHKAHLSKGDLMAKLREANVLQLSEVRAVVLETTGDVSVLHTSSEEDVADEVMYKVAVKK